MVEGLAAPCSRGACLSCYMPILRAMSVSTDRVLSPSEVAELFGVGAKTVTRWADSGLLPYFKTLGGHRRFRYSEVTALIGRGEVDGSAHIQG